MPLTVIDLLVRLDRFPWAEWRRRLSPGMTQVYRDVVNTAGKPAAAAAGGTWDFQDPFLSRWMTRYVGERIVQLEATTKTRIAALLRDQFDQAPETTLLEQSRAILDAVREEYTGYEGWRAARIARTERAIAANHGAALGYAQAGVQEVEVSDGTEDDECAAANGQIWSVAKALSDPVAHPNAVMAGTRVSPLGAVSEAYRVRWAGPTITLRTREGVSLTVSPQHPVLTGRGWIPATSIQVGDQVVRDSLAQGVRSAHADLKDVIPRIEQVVESLFPIGLHTRVMAAATHFHGDGRYGEGEIDVVRANRFLETQIGIDRSEPLRELACVGADAEASGLARARSRFAPPDRVLLPSARRVRGFDTRRIFPVLSERDTSFSEAFSDWQVADAELATDLKRRLARQITLDDIVHIERETLATHAFDLTTQSGAYWANGILVHNCVRAFSPIPVNDAQRRRARETFTLWIAGQDPAVAARNAAAILDKDDPCARAIEVDDAA